MTLIKKDNITYEDSVQYSKAIGTPISTFYTSDFVQYLSKFGELRLFSNQIQLINSGHTNCISFTRSHLTANYSGLDVPSNFYIESVFITDDGRPGILFRVKD